MTASRFSKLVDLARAQNSAQRRELLREVTDLFFETNAAHTSRQAALFDDVLKLVAADMQEEVLIELSTRFAGVAGAPAGLMRDLANHAFVVAAPVLKHSEALTDAVLINVIRNQSQEHISAVAQRKAVSEAVSEVIIEVGDDDALDLLMRNDGARLSRTGMEKAVDRARECPFLHTAVVGRRDLPLDLLNELYFIVETGLREQILKRNASVDPADLDKALTAARTRMRKHNAQLSEENRQAKAYVHARKVAGELNAQLLVSLYRDGKHARFLWALAELTDIDYEVAYDIIARKDVDALAMICRAAGFHRALFVTLALLTCGEDDALGLAEEVGRHYNTVPVEAAQRAMRFFKVRKAAEQTAAA